MRSTAKLKEVGRSCNLTKKVSQERLSSIDYVKKYSCAGDAIIRFVFGAVSAYLAKSGVDIRL